MGNNRALRRRMDVLAAIHGDEWLEGRVIGDRCGVTDVNPYLTGLFRDGLVWRLRDGTGPYRYIRRAPTKQDDAS